jgi:hypothetical protein
MKSVAESTPMQRPWLSTTGAPVTPARASMRAAPCNDISRGTITTFADMMSAAHWLISDLVCWFMRHLLGSGDFSWHRKYKAKRMPMIVIEIWRDLDTFPRKNDLQELIREEFAQ